MDSEMDVERQAEKTQKRQIGRHTDKQNARREGRDK